MAAPTITTIRAGVAFSPQAAMSFRRAESDLGRQIGTNSTYRDWDKQLGMHRAWNRYVASGRKPALYPGHSMALHPSASKHCLGLALDSNEWVSATFNLFMAERGWIRTAANDPTERHHYEYQAWRDQHRNRPAGAGGHTPIEEDDMFTDADRATLNNLTAILATEPNAGTTRGIKGALEVIDRRVQNVTAILATEPNAGTTRGLKGAIEHLTALVQASPDVVADVPDADLTGLASSVADEIDRRNRERLTK